MLFQRFSTCHRLAPALFVWGLASLAPASAGAQWECPAPAAPYVFVVFDTSGSTNWSPICTADALAAGDCNFLCPTGDCRVPRDADDPASKSYQMRQALEEAIFETGGIHFGFAHFNQDVLKARAKHWTYTATSAGVTIPGWGAFPAVGESEVFGLTWACDTGTGDHDIGCYANTPADLPDAWERERVLQLPKGGISFSSFVIAYVRQGTTVYRVRWTPVAGGTLGGPLSMTVRLDRCLSPTNCTSPTLIEQKVVTYTPAGEFLPWDNGVDRTNPSLGFFAQTTASDVNSSNSCAGWEPNNDAAADLSSGYSLMFPTVADPLHTLLDEGDVIPLDWRDDHALVLRERLAPSLAFLGGPDYRISPYLRDQRVGVETQLRLEFEQQRPMLAFGPTPIGAAMTSFRNWYGGSVPGSGFADLAAANDPDFFCRPKYLLMLIDGDDTCAGSPCAVAQELWQQHGVRTQVIAFGMDPAGAAGSQIPCMAANGGTTALYPANARELKETLLAVFGAMKSGL